jgi:hypothetical protein
MVRTANKTFRNVRVRLIGGVLDGTYSLYENVGDGRGKPFHVAEDAYKASRNVDMIDYADKLVRLPTPDPDDVDAPLSEVTWYFTPEGWAEYIKSREQLSAFFDGVPEASLQSPYRESRVIVNELDDYERIVYEDDYQIAVVE